MTDAAAAETRGSATVVPEAMAWDSRTKRVVLLYVPLACFVFILLFPFYWMAVTTFKPNAELYDYKTYN
ncbi:MAG: carbohydrate ABC transporter permease, partial [Alphaproteobacteria bacterium]